MFNSISGLITEKSASSLYIDTNGIEWDVMMSTEALQKLGSVGTQGRVFVWLYHREDQMKVYGFYSVKERNLFLDLLKVEGIGPRQALKVLSSLSINELEKALEDSDISKLETSPGIGKKTAQKMILTLKGKLTQIDSPSVNKSVPHERNDIIESLVEMGFDRKRVVDVLESIQNQNNDISKNPSQDSAIQQQQNEQELFRQALILLSS